MVSVPSLLNHRAIREVLVEHGKAIYDAPREEVVPFTGNDHADRLLNDLAGHPHAFVLACIMDRQVKAERAWMIPFRIKEKLQDFSMNRLVALSRDDVRRLMAKPEPLHRFVGKMATFFFSGVQRIGTRYNSNASLIWADKPSSAMVVYRFLEFEGVGPKIASMAANVLARDFKIELSDYYSIDISVDVQVRRVFGRLGLTAPDASVEQVVYRARSLHPEFPGLLDLPSWEIGRKWCRPRMKECGSCYMREACPTARDDRRRRTEAV